MAYTVYRSDGSPVVVSLPQNTTYSLTLSGTGSLTYPQDIAQNFLRHLENFANGTPPSGTILTGQLWYDTIAAQLKIFNGTTWVATGTGGGGGGGSTSTVNFDGGTPSMSFVNGPGFDAGGVT